MTQKAVPTEIKVTPQVAAEHGLTAEEYARIQKILGRDPNYHRAGHFQRDVERALLVQIFARASEAAADHAARTWCRGRAKMRASWISATASVAVFKIESHNHPSFVEPFQGAATGVGGILRDIFTMGARPIAVLDSLRFGPITPGPSAGTATPEEIARNRRILDGVIRGIGFYGNCFGVPTVGGEVAIRTVLLEQSAGERARAWALRDAKNFSSRRRAARAIP